LWCGCAWHDGMGQQDVVCRQHSGMAVWALGAGMRLVLLHACCMCGIPGTLHEVCTVNKIVQAVPNRGQLTSSVTCNARCCAACAAPGSQAPRTASYHPPAKRSSISTFCCFFPIFEKRGSLYIAANRLSLMMRGFPSLEAISASFLVSNYV
jgi:hypothetical protein